MRKSQNGADLRPMGSPSRAQHLLHRLYLAFFRLMHRKGDTSPRYSQLFRYMRNVGSWRGWRVLSKAVLIGVHIALVYALAKVVLFPTDNPQEDWVPSKWGKPWSTGPNSWANIASRRKALLKELDSLSFQPPDSTQLATPPKRLKYPILWAAPFFSRSGYGTEAISYIAGLIQYGLIAKEDLWITQAGDGRHPDALDGLDPSIRQLLWDQEWHNITRRLSPEDRDRPLIVVCHVFPDCWRTASDDKQPKLAAVRFLKWVGEELKNRLWGIDHKKDNGCPCPNKYIKDRVVYRVGRSMFETERLPAPLVAYAEDLDEVLVPSRFNVESFAKSGIPAKKLHTLAQGINTTLFDPLQHRAIDLASLEGSQVTGPSRPYVLNTGVVQAQAPVKHARRLRQHMPATQSDTLHTAQHIQADQADLTADSQQGAAAGRTLLAQGKDSNAHGHHAGGAKAAISAAIGWVEKELEEVASVTGGHVQKPYAPYKDPNDPFRFLSVFKWETRKGWDVLLRAYFSEFSINDNVELHVVTHAFGQQIDDFRTFMRDAIKKLLNQTADDYLDSKLARVYVYDKYIPDCKYPALYQAMDALVVPTHGEGWGRPQFEAMAMGLPVITTNWSGITAFMDESVGYPIKVEAIVEVNDPSPEAFFWFKEQRWAQPSRTHLQQLMRHVISHREEAASKGRAARRRVVREYSILAVARKAYAEIQRIENQVHSIMFGEAR